MIPFSVRSLIFSWMRRPRPSNRVVLFAFLLSLHTSCSFRWLAEPEEPLQHRGKRLVFLPWSSGNIERIEHQIIKTQGHILRRNSNRLSGRWQEDVVRRHHQEFCFKLRFNRKRNVNGHLVTVKVGVKGRADERMDADRFTFDQDRLKRLDTQTVQRRRTVKKNRMSFNDLFKHVPHFRSMPLNHFLCRADRIDIAQDLSSA